jgi:hypothetical protein
MARRAPGPVQDIIRAIRSESDRGCVLVSAAWMDEQLRTFIETLLLAVERGSPNPVLKTELLGKIDSLLSGMFDSAMNRTDFCRATGMIDASMHLALRALFQLRNRHFGHFAGISRLTNPEPQDLLKNFFDAYTLSPELLNARLPGDGKVRQRRHSKIRRRFMSQTMVMAMILVTGGVRFPKVQFERPDLKPGSPRFEYQPPGK